MSIEMMQEELLTLRDAAKRLPRTSRGKSIHASAIYRWASAGLRGVRLEVIHIGGRMFTSMEALGRFVHRLTDAKAGESEDRRAEEGDRPRSRRYLDEELERRLAGPKG